MTRGISAGLITALLAGACASAPNVDTPPTVLPPVAQEVAENPASTTRNEIIKSDELVFDVPVQQVWRALSEVYTELQIPVTAADATTCTIVSSQQRVRRIGGTLVDRFFECGGSWENHASRGDLWLEVRSQAQPMGEGHTVVRTPATSMVRPADTSVMKPCPGNGNLQRLIRKRLEQKLGVAAR